MQLFSADDMVFSKKKKKYFFDPEKVKKRASKVLIIGPDPFISQSSPDQRPTAQNRIFILGIVGTRHLFSYLCLETGKENMGKSWNSHTFGSIFVFFLLHLNIFVILKHIFISFSGKNPYLLIPNECAMISHSNTWEIAAAFIYSSNEIRKTQNEHLNIAYQNLNPM